MSRVKRVRPILQMERTECGAASLAMILSYYGKNVTLEEMRHACSVSRNGVNAKNIILAARLYGLNTTALRIDAEEARDLELPAIIHWNMDHFLVLCGFNRRGAVIADPADGIKTVSLSEFNKAFTGIAIQLTPGENFEKLDKTGRKENYIYLCAKKYIPSVVYIFLTELVVMLGTVSALFLNSIFIDRILIAGNDRNLAVILQVLLAAGALSAAAMVVNIWIKKRIGQMLNIDLNTGFIEHILKLPIVFFKSRNEGDLTNRQSATMRMGIGLSEMVLPIPASVMQIIIYLLLVFVFDINVAILAVISSAANIVAMLYSSKSYREKIMPYNRDMGKLQGEISNVANRIETIKSCGIEDGALMLLMSTGARIANEKISIEKTGINTESLYSYINAFCSALILIAGIVRIFQGHMTTGMLIAAQAIAAALLAPIGSAVNSGIAVQTLRGEAQRTDDVMNYREDKKFLDEGDTQQGMISGDMELRDVVFGYNPLDAPAVSAFNMRLEKGRTVAITGASGSGKSTVSKLIAGIYSPQGGKILFSGMEIGEINHRYFYSKVSMVSQNARLFDGTVADNITMWDNSIPYDDIVAAAKTACIHEDILLRKNGYDEIVTENGTNFSGGQRQRIEIARALVKKPEILILDEATSALDTITEKRVMDNIRALGITCIIVAHRLSTIIDCDEIIMLQNGEIKERGTHSSLMADKGQYYRLIRSGN